MDPNYQVIVVVAAGVVLAVMIAVRIPDMFQDRSRLNSTADWTPGPAHQQKTPTMTCLTPYDLRLITSHLESGETLEGLARAFFVPHRLKDYRFGTVLEKVPRLEQSMATYFRWLAPRFGSSPDPGSSAPRVAA